MHRVRVGHGSGPPRRPALKIGHGGRPIKPGLAKRRRPGSNVGVGSAISLNTNDRAVIPRKNAMAEKNVRLASILRKHEARLLTEWMSELARSGRGALDKADLEEQARTFVRLLSEAVQ